MESGPGINGTLKEIPRGGSDSPPFGFLTSLSSTAAGLSLRPTQKGSKMVPPAAPALASALLKTGVNAFNQKLTTGLSTIHVIWETTFPH